MNYLKYVNIKQGSKSLHRFSQGNTLPLVQKPFGFAAFSLQTETSRGSWYYHPDDRSVEGIRLTRQPSPWISDHSAFTMMPQIEKPYVEFEDCWSGYAPEKATEAIDISLENLGLDYLDLYLIHWPCVEKVSPDWKEINAETWRAFEDAYKNGKIRAIGVSNFQKKHYDALAERCEIKPMVNQIEFHPGYTQPETVAYSQEMGMLVQAFSPLGCGAVLGDETLADIAKKYGKTVAQVCLRFVLQSGLNVLTKSVTPARIIENAAIFDFELSAEDMAVISAMPELGFTGWLPENAPADALV